MHSPMGIYYRYETGKPAVHWVSLPLSTWLRKNYTTLEIFLFQIKRTSLKVKFCPKRHFLAETPKTGFLMVRHILHTKRFSVMFTGNRWGCDETEYCTSGIDRKEWLDNCCGLGKGKEQEWFVNCADVAILDDCGATMTSPAPTRPPGIFGTLNNVSFIHNPNFIADVKICIK